MPPPPASVPPPPSRWCLYGDLPWRMLLGGVRACPSWLETPLIAVWSFLIFLIAGPQRRAVTGNLQKLLPATGCWRRMARAYRTFYQFARAAVDGIRYQQGAEVLTWEVAGMEHLDAAAAQDRPVILCTAHMGTYDAAAACFADKLQRPFFAVRLPERHPRLQQLREQGLSRLRKGSYTALYNTSENILGVELLRALQRRDWVAIQADRALPGLTVLPFSDGTKTWLLPKGPFVLATAAGACCLPSFVRRLGHRRYRITFHPPMLPDPAVPRGEAVEALARRWTRLLGEVVRSSPDQWLVFEPAFES